MMTNISTASVNNGRRWALYDGCLAGDRVAILQVQRDRGFGVGSGTKITKRSFIGRVRQVNERDSENIITPYDNLEKGGH